MYICPMKVYIGVVNGKIKPEGYTSLQALCKELGVSYDSAVRGKREWAYRVNQVSTIIEICEIVVVKIKGRGSL